MTTETLTEAPIYTILTTGPYAIPHAWSREGDLVVEVRDADGGTIALTPPDWSVSPATSNTGGDLTLDPGIVGTHQGKSLVITRETLVEQGWLGQAARERGLEGEIDRTARGVQDLRALTDRMPRLPRGTAAHRPQIPDPVADSVLVGRSDGQGWDHGPTVDEVANAQSYSLLAQAWAESPSAPGDPGTKSSKTWAGDAESEAADAAHSAEMAAIAAAADTMVFHVGDTPDGLGAIFVVATRAILTDPGPGDLPSITIEVP